MDEQPTVGVLEQFQTEFTEFWGRLPNKGFFFALLAGWLTLFHFFGNPTLGYVDTPSLFSWMIWKGIFKMTASACGYHCWCWV
jgi:hypothetical protein